MFCEYCKENHVKPKLGESNKHWTWVKNNNLLAKGRHVCDRYISDYRKDYRHSKKGWAIIRYNTQVKNSKKRGHKPPDYTSDELYEWAISQSHFQNLFSEWENSGFEKDLSPSCDRLDDDKPYTFENLRIITTKENTLLGARSEKAKIKSRQAGIEKTAIKVDRYSKEGIYIDSFESSSSASRELKIDQSSITKCCKNKVNTAGGFKWKYSDK